MKSETNGNLISRCTAICEYDELFCSENKIYEEGRVFRIWKHIQKYDSVALTLMVHFKV